MSASRRGFTLAELMVTVAIAAILGAIAAAAMTSARRVSRVGGQARYILQQLQSVRTSAVSQGAAQGYFIGQNGPGATGTFANQAFVFWKLNPTATVVSYVAGPDRVDGNFDTLPLGGPGQSLVVVDGTSSGSSVIQAAPIQIGFDMNGQVTVTPGPVVFPYCIRISDLVDQTIIRYVILFNDGTTKVQGNETWCP